MTETATSATARKASAARPLPSTLRLGLARGAIENKTFFREKDAVIFTFSFPIILLVLFGSIFSGDMEGTGITVSQLYTAGLIAPA